MYVFKLAALLLALAPFCSSLEIRKVFSEMTGEAARFRDVCFQEQSLTIEDLHDYDSSDEITETELCFYKCFYQRTSVIDETGRVVVELMMELPEYQALGEDERQQFLSCVNGLSPIVQCKDVAQLEVCFN